VLLRKTADIHFQIGLGWALVNHDDILSLDNANWNVNVGV
jgi:hypothetical protein